MKECCITALSDMPWYNTSVLKKRIQEIYAAMRRNGEQHEKSRRLCTQYSGFPGKGNYFQRYYLYFTSFCVVECMHVHASDRRLTEAGSAKFFVRDNGDTVLQERGILTDREISKIQKFIKQNYQEMYLKWSAYSEQGFYNKK